MIHPTSFASRDEELAYVEQFNRRPVRRGWRAVPSWQVPRDIEFEPRPATEGAIVQEFVAYWIGRRRMTKWLQRFDRADGTVTYYVKDELWA